MSFGCSISSTVHGFAMLCSSSTLKLFRSLWFSRHSQAQINTNSFITSSFILAYLYSFTGTNMEGFSKPGARLQLTQNKLLQNRTIQYRETKEIVDSTGYEIFGPRKIG